MGSRKQLTFDVDTRVCREIYENERYTMAYAEIKAFMKENDFIHIEGSSYMSNRSMSNMEISNMLDDFLVKYPHMSKCIKRMHQADISNIHSLEHHFEYDGTAGEFAREEGTVVNRSVRNKRRSRPI